MNSPFPLSSGTRAILSPEQRRLFYTCFPFESQNLWKETECQNGVKRSGLWFAKEVSRQVDLSFRRSDLLFPFAPF
jgi:hypothetical protein